MNRFLKANNYIEINLQTLHKFEIQRRVYTLDNNNNFLFVLCVEGSIPLKMVNREYMLNKNDAMYIQSGQSVHIQVNKGSCLVLEFNGTAINDIIAQTTISIIDPIIHNEKALIEGINKIYDCYQKEGFLSLKSLGVFYEMLHKLMKKNKKKNIVETNNVHIEKAKIFIEQNYHQDISISDVSKYCKITSNYLANIFMEHLNYSPKTYLIKIRMEQALKLLMTGKFKVNEVSKKVGYKNQLHFSSEFKKYYGKSPIDIIKENR